MLTDYVDRRTDEAAPWTPHKLIPVFSHYSQESLLQKGFRPFFQFFDRVLLFAFRAPEESGRLAALCDRCFVFQKEVPIDFCFGFRE